MRFLKLAPSMLKIAGKLKLPSLFTDLFLTPQSSRYEQSERMIKVVQLTKRVCSFDREPPQHKSHQKISQIMWSKIQFIFLESMPEKPFPLWLSPAKLLMQKQGKYIPERVEIIPIAHDWQSTSADITGPSTTRFSIAARWAWLDYCRYLSAKWWQANAETACQPTLNCWSYWSLSACQLLQLWNTRIITAQHWADFEQKQILVPSLYDMRTNNIHWEPKRASFLWQKFCQLTNNFHNFWKFARAKTYKICISCIIVGC